jgi:hypothetical protein
MKVSEDYPGRFSFLTLALILLVGFAGLLAVLLVCGGGIGWLLHRWWPSIETGTAMLIGVVASGMAVQFLAKTIGSMLTEGVSVPAPVSERWVEVDDDDTFYLPPVPRRSSSKRPRRRTERGKGAA